MTHVKSITPSELRGYARGADYSCERDAFNRAADEIERLTGIVDRLREACGTVSDKTASIVLTMPFELVGTAWSQALSDASAIAFRASCEAAEKAREK